MSFVELIILYIFAIIGVWVLFHWVGRKVLGPIIVRIYLIIKLAAKVRQGVAE